MQVPIVKKSSANQRKERYLKKYIQWVTTLRRQCGSIFILLAVVASQLCEITRSSLKVRTYSSSRSSKVINLRATRKRICDFLLVIDSNLGRNSHRFRDWRILLENGLFT